MEARPIAEASTFALVQQTSTREQLLKIVIELQTAVLGLESVEEIQIANVKLLAQYAKVEHERQKIDKLAKQAIQNQGVPKRSGEVEYGIGAVASC